MLNIVMFALPLPSSDASGFDRDALQCMWDPVGHRSVADGRIDLVGCIEENEKMKVVFSNLSQKEEEDEMPTEKSWFWSTAPDAA
jgi:hypothetical protein